MWSERPSASGVPSSARESARIKEVRIARLQLKAKKLQGELGAYSKLRARRVSPMLGSFRTETGVLESDLLGGSGSRNERLHKGRQSVQKDSKISYTKCGREGSPRGWVTKRKPHTKNASQ